LYTHESIRCLFGCQMTAHPWMPLYTKNLTAATRDLDAARFGIYVMLLILAWESEGSLPNDMDWVRTMLKRSLGVHGHQFNNTVPDLLERYFKLDNGRWTNKRLTKEKEKADKRSANARQMADKRWSKNEKKNDKPSADSNEINGFSDAVAYAKADANNNHNHNNKEEDIDSVVLPTRKKQLPEDWTLSLADSSYAYAKGWAAERVLSEAERFKNHHLARGTVFKNWSRAWQNWVTSPYQQPTRTSNGKASNSPEKGKSDFKDALRKLGEYAERDGGEISEEAVRLLPSARRE
jgi:uncharacterized protein YdaU (DUF1376 family)